MLKHLPLDTLAQRLSETLPAEFTAFRADIKKTVRAIVQANLEQMHLVSREEFEVQRMVLARTRAKLECLEERVADLERLIGAGT